ncbi:hypothetical protein HF675_04140 [Serratia sp. JUb9]|uniref:colicin-like pore-forming protein n=1 Tax=Serratia sp. JUb9 TaxID=2724469 RepID=UPI00164DFB69|nr:colicin-like pore-forming protein [Serratia sp. JUb9]QNK33256.1 hypothetical protein HF675_04140 [Serratia sp. JUb9]
MLNPNEKFIFCAPEEGGMTVHGNRGGGYGPTGPNGNGDGYGHGNGGGPNVAWGGTLTDVVNGVVMTFIGVHAIGPTGPNIHWGGDSNGYSGGSWGTLENTSKASVTTPIITHSYTFMPDGHLNFRRDLYNVMMNRDLTFRVNVINQDPEQIDVSVTKVPRGGASLGKERAEDVKRIMKDFLQYESAIHFMADFYKEVTQKFGERSTKIAQNLADSVKGKTIRNTNEALAAYEKYKGNINKKLSAADREAIATALESLNHQQMANNLIKFSKAFGYVGKSLDRFDLVMELAKGIRNDDWAPFFVKVETLTAGRLATALVAFIFSLLSLTPMGLLGYGLLMAITSALIDDALVKEVNDVIFG